MAAAHFVAAAHPKIPLRALKLGDRTSYYMGSSVAWALRGVQGARAVSADKRINKYKIYR